ncbi:hypothetical protein BD414DRAFT_475528 [Trametes punicea]|nr:hypothetical protein BD414DRAFT_475528 [Trametes punicea]
MIHDADRLQVLYGIDISQQTPADLRYAGSDLAMHEAKEADNDAYDGWACVHGNGAVRECCFSYACT